VVESAVNFVGVDVNTASPALLRYVSGLNALTARRIYEYRRERGPFKNREELKEVPGVGESTFVQAAGFLKILGGDNPLDATWIHPESYDIARRVLERFGSSVEELAEAVPEPVEPPVKKDAADFGKGLVEEAAPTADAATSSGSSTDQASTDQASTDEASQPPTQPTAQANEDDPFQQAEGGAIQTSEAIVTAALNETLTDDIIAMHMPESAPEAVSPEHLLANVAGEVTEPPSARTAVSEPPPAAPRPPKPNPIAEKLANIDVQSASQELQVSPLLLEDIVTSLARPGRDPREELPPPMFRRGIMKLEDLQPGMELQGTVLNVVDFGAFVDIGLSDSGLVHISRLADRFIRDPHEVVGVGDLLKLWVVDIDRGRRRVSLTAIEPGSERPPRPKREERAERPPRAQQPQQARPQRPKQGGGPPSGGPAQGGRAQQGGPPPTGQPPRPRHDRRPQRGGPPKRDQGPRVIERPATKPKVVKPITKAQEEGKQPLRSFSDLMQLLDKKKEQKPEPPPPE
jgi:protein Tex